MAAGPPTSSIEIEVVQEDPFDKRFRNLPNALLRGERDDVLDLDFRGYTLRARALLSALLSMKDRYRCSRERINALASELGESAMDTVIKELKTKRNLRTKRVNGGDGKFVWRWTVSLRPMEAAATEDPPKSVSAGRAMGRLSGDGPNGPATIPPSSTDGSSTDGSVGGLIEEPQPLEEPPNPKRTRTPSPGTVGAERTVRNARGRTSAAPPRAKEPSPSRSSRQSQASPAALALLAQLPRPWRECEPWVRQRLAGKLDKVLGQYGPAAILWAFQTHGRDPAKVLSAEGRPAGNGETRHLTAMDRVLTLFRKDVQGGACRDCALEHPGRPCGDPLLTLVPGLCIVCDSPDATVRPELPLKSFACDPCWADMTDGAPAGEAA